MRLNRFWLFTGFLGLALLLAGCGADRSPVASDVESVQPEGQSYIVFGADRAAKVAEATVSMSTSGTFYPNQWGSIGVSDWSWGAADEDGSIIVKRLWFAVEWGAIERQVDISLTAFWGDELGDVSVAFTPSGLDFNPPATLEIALHGPLTDDMFAGGAYHVDANGNATQAEFEIRKELTDGNNSEWVVVIKVPGFSRNALGGGD